MSSVFRAKKSHKRRGGGGGRGGCLKKTHESGGRTRARKTVSRGVQEQPKGSQSYSQEAPGELPREAKECRRAPRVAWESQRMLRARYESPRTAPKSAGREATKRRRAPRVAWENERKLLARYESPKKHQNRLVKGGSRFPSSTRRAPKIGKRSYEGTKRGPGEFQKAFIQIYESQDGAKIESDERC